MRCDGIQGIDLDSLPEDQRLWLEQLEADGIIAPSSPGDLLFPQQRYKRYPCRYKRDVYWSITGKCNYSCKHCLVSAPHAKFGHPTTEQLLNLVEQMAACGIGAVSVTGGEPLIRSDFWQIVDALRQHGIALGMIFTNGYLVNDALLDGLEARGMHPGFQMSYDGVGWHDWLRGFEGAEAAVDRAFRLLQARGFQVDAAMCLHRGNAHTIRESVLHLASLGVGSLKVNRIQELGEWEAASEEVALSEDESLQLYLDYIPQYFEDDCPIALMLDGAFTFDPDEPHRMGMEFVRPCATDATSEKRLSCGILKTSMYTGPDGSVCPCMSMADSQVNDWPNAFETPLADILGETPFMNRCAATIGQVRDANEKCRTCSYIDKCNGGCRAMAVCSSPDYLAVDSSCCHFFLNGWHERFQTVSATSRDAYLARHPEIAAATESDNAGRAGRDEDDERPPFSNC
ncbi:MAG: radical SAM protein [Coriobacteriia bacterium]|nr:radical SAM protein [Coriobacteriia bacterium]